MNPYHSAAKVLQASGVPYVVVGGFAVVMHGVNRFTPDFNVVVDFSSPNLPKLYDALEGGEFEAPALDYRDLLSTEQKRREFFADGKNWFMSFHHREKSSFRFDVMVDYPVPINELRENAFTPDVAASGTASEILTICSHDILVRLKQDAKRGQDMLDLESLKIVDSLLSGEEGLLAEFDKERVENLRAFQELSPYERVEWLGRMLDEISALLF